MVYSNKGACVVKGARVRIAAYGLLIFLTSACVLVVEIVAARLTAPFVGVSLYSWTAIIGVVLAGLSLGNWLGGVWADRGAGERAAALILFCSGVSVFAVLLVLPPATALLYSMDLSIAGLSLLLAAVLFFPPAALLGVLTPLLTTMALKLSTRTGHVVGMMHALAALGSIAGTFLTGFVLVQWVGSRNIVLFTASALILMALPLLTWRAAVVAALCGLAAGGAAVSAYAHKNPCREESAYYCLRWVDSSHDVPLGEARSLILDHLMHGTNHRQHPTLIAASYLHLMDELASRQLGERGGGRHFFAGGGAYTLPRALHSRDAGAAIVVAEIDPGVTGFAAGHLFLATEGMEVRHVDARQALHGDAPASYDVIMGDVFHDIAVPYHLITREFAALVRERLTPDGIYLMNLVDAFPDARLLKSLVKTLRGEFAEVKVWVESYPRAPQRLTYVISARMRGPNFGRVLENERGMPRQWFDVTEKLLAHGSPYAQAPVLSDDLVPVERLMTSLFVGRLGR